MGDVQVACSSRFAPVIFIWSIIFNWKCEDHKIIAKSPKWYVLKKAMIVIFLCTQYLQVYKDEPDRKAFWYDATIHAREWLATATFLQIIDHVRTPYNTFITFRQKQFWVHINER